jgi:hypothetical protein
MERKNTVNLAFVGFSVMLNGFLEARCVSLLGPFVSLPISLKKLEEWGGMCILKLLFPILE